MSRIQITIDLDAEIERRACQRARELGISLPEYVRRLVIRDLGVSYKVADPSAVFDLGDSGGSNIAASKDALIAEASFLATPARFHLAKLLESQILAWWR